MKNQDQFYMGLAYETSVASYAKRKKVGAILVRNHNIIAFGYNGTPHGFSNVCEEGNVTKKEVLHAESNAITKCAKSTSSSEGATLYVTVSPCYECAKLVIQSGIVRVCYIEEYHDLSGLELLTRAKIPTQKIIL